MKFAHRYILALMLLLLAATTWAQESTTAYNFLSMTPSSHVYALGGHNLTIIDDDINLMEQNPALLGPEVDHQIGLNYMKYIGSSNFMGVRYGQGLTEHSAFGVSLQYYGYGSITAADADGTITGTFSPRDLAVALTYSHDITDYLRGGISLKYVSSSYDSYSAAAIAADLGINYYNSENDLSLSLVARNLGGQVKKFTDHKESLPWDIQLGYSQSLTGAPVRVSITAYNLRKWHLPYYQLEDRTSSSSALIKKDSFGSNLMRHLVFGVEVLPSDNIYVGVGYNYKTRTDMSNYNRNLLSGFSIGAGLKARAFGFGIALAQPHTGATTFMFNLTTSIGELIH